MIDMVPAIGNAWTPGSATAAVIRAIQCHGDIEDSKRIHALQKVCPLSDTTFLIIVLIGHTTPRSYL